MGEISSDYCDQGGKVARMIFLLKMKTAPFCCFPELFILYFTGKARIAQPAFLCCAFQFLLSSVCAMEEKRFIGRLKIQSSQFQLEKEKLFSIIYRGYWDLRNLSLIGIRAGSFRALNIKSCESRSISSSSQRRQVDFLEECISLGTSSILQDFSFLDQLKEKKYTAFLFIDVDRNATFLSILNETSPYQ